MIYEFARTAFSAKFGTRAAFSQPDQAPKQTYPAIQWWDASDDTALAGVSAEEAAFSHDAVAKCSEPGGMQTKETDNTFANMYKEGKYRPQYYRK